MVFYEKFYYILEDVNSSGKEIIKEMEEKKLPAYEAPRVITYTDDEILEELGPAQTGYIRGDSAF